MSLTIEQIQQLKTQFKKCAYCNNAIDALWVKSDYTYPHLMGHGTFFRCKDHLPITHSLKSFYRLSEKEMFAFKIL
jgi:hypothetical protein